MNPKGPPFSFFGTMHRFRSFFQKKNFSKKIFQKNFQKFFVSSREKWFSSHIEHERHTLGVSKVFSKLFMNTSWEYLENWAFWALDIAPTLDVPVLFLFQLTILLWIVHFFAIFCSFVQLILWEAGDRGFVSRTKRQIFIRRFSKIFEFYQRVPPCVFWSFRFVKTFNDPEWPIFEFFSILRLFLKKILFL